MQGKHDEVILLYFNTKWTISEQFNGYCDNTVNSDHLGHINDSITQPQSRYLKKKK